MRSRWVFVAAVSTCLAWGAQAQSVRSLVNGGNDLYEEKKFTDAEVNYRKALDKERGLLEGHFNLGNALYQQGKYAEAAREYEQAVKSAVEPNVRADAYYNIGNTLLKGQDAQNAIRAYIESLKLDPTDQAAKHNLSYALKMLQQQQQQQQQQNKNQDKGQNKNQQQNQDQQQQDQQRQDQDRQRDREQQQAQQRQRQISPQEAERILEVLRNNEKDVQKKLRSRQAVRARTEKDW